MLRRNALALALPLALALGCGSAPPPPAAPPPTQIAPADDAKLGGASGDTHGSSSLEQAMKSPPPPPPPPPLAKGSGAAKGKDTGAPGRAMTTDAPIVSKITQDDILALVNQNSDVFYRCYNLGAGASKSWRATVTVKATVSPLGTVSAIEVTSSTTKSPKVDACVIDGFKKLTFSRPANSGATVFTFPMQFEPMQQVQ